MTEAAYGIGSLIADSVHAVFPIIPTYGNTDEIISRWRQRGEGIKNLPKTVLNKADTVILYDDPRPATSGLAVTAATAGAAKVLGPLSKLGAKGLIPQGLSKAQFIEGSQIVRGRAAELGLGDDIFVHGSRASGTAKATSDIDIGIRLSPKEFDAFLNSQSKLASPRAGSSLAKTRAYAIENGIIQRGEARLSPLGRQLERLFGMNVDISIIRAGGNFDRGPYMPLHKQ